MQRRGVLALAVGALLGGCGSAGPGPGPPPAAEPTASPPPTAAPAGRVTQIGNLPEGLVVDPVSGLLAVGLRGPDELALVDARSGAVIRRVALPGAPRHLALAAPGGPVLVPAERINALLRVSLPGGVVSRTRVGAFPHDAAASGGRVLVGNERAGTVSIIAGSRVVATLSRGLQPGGTAPLPGGRVAVVDVRDRILRIYALRPSPSPTVVGSVGLGGGPTHIVAVGDRLYVADTGGQAVLALDAVGAPRITGRTPAPGAPYAIAADPRRHRLWVTLTARNQLVEYALGGPAPVEIARYPTVRQPDSVAVDPRDGRVFVAGRDPGQLESIDPPHSRRRSG